LAAYRFAGESACEATVNSRQASRTRRPRRLIAKLRPALSSLPRIATARRDVVVFDLRKEENIGRRTTDIVATLFIAQLSAPRQAARDAIAPGISQCRAIWRSLWRRCEPQGGARSSGARGAERAFWPRRAGAELRDGNCRCAQARHIAH